MTVWDAVVGQDEAVRVLRAAAGGADGGMTHAWLFTGPPGSGRSVAARAFAAALQCADPAAGPGCGECPGCRTVLAGTHADVREVVPEGLSISVSEMRTLVAQASRRPSSGRWQVLLVEDADRLTEGAANALLKTVEEPPPRTVMLLCAPSDHPEDIAVTLRSRCRAVALRTPPASAVAGVLQRRDGLDPDTASWAASVGGGHVGRARRLATDPDARSRREAVLRMPMTLRSQADVFALSDELIAAVESEATGLTAARNAAETEELETALGGGGTGRGAAAAMRGAKGAIRELEKRQKSRATRSQRDALDRALVDLAGFYRDALVNAWRAPVALTHPDRSADSATAAAQWAPESLLRRLEAVLACREALELNVKPRIAVEAMASALQQG